MPVRRPAIWFWAIFIGTVLPLQTFLSPQFTGYARTGLYDTQYGMVLPDRITIYRLAICAICDSADEVADQVRKTVIHEVGHHFGIDDERLRELGW